MGPVVRLSDETWNRMKKHAEPLTDSPDDVVRKLLDIADRVPNATRGPTIQSPAAVQTVERPARLPRDLRMPNKQYRMPVLRALIRLGGSAPPEDVLNVVRDMMKDRLSDYDLAPIPSGTDVRWHKAANWERFAMVQDGLLSADSRRGIWEITEEGRKLAGS